MLGAAAGLAVLLWCTLRWAHVAAPHDTRRAVLFGAWVVHYDDQRPPLLAVLGAIVLILASAAGVAIMERRISDRSRRSRDGLATPLAPRVVMERTRGVFAGPVTVTVLIPAHNEQTSLPATLSSLLAQSSPPQRIVVVADNCTDDTVTVARAAGVEVFESRDNHHKKAGALNQALAALLPEQGDNDLVMVMDADTILDDGFLAAAVHRFTDDRALMAVGGLFYGEDGAGVLGQFQRNEYIRYSREVRRRRGRVFVLTGTASLFRPVGLRTVAASRGTLLPGRTGDVYDTAALTEDNELTIALKSLGGLMQSPAACTVVTEVMPTWRTLWAQRLRWQRGALENLGAYGVTPQTFRYWAQQLGIGYGALALFSYFVLMAVTALSVDRWTWFPFWMGVGVLFIAERVVTVWRGGWRARLLALALLPELYYSAVLNAAFLKGILDITRGRQASWKHVERPTTPAVAA
ncbi:MAG: glycosyltransferase [Jatrophihabitans sp.]|uniref:glycosyltransferase n=1 Tax=Jatrophihabitans sp. TaxID=1932789 RepID=UPI003F7F5593